MMIHRLSIQKWAFLNETWCFSSSVVHNLSFAGLCNQLKNQVWNNCIFGLEYRLGF